MFVVTDEVLIMCIYYFNVVYIKLYIIEKIWVSIKTINIKNGKKWVKFKFKRAIKSNQTINKILNIL